MQPICKTDSNCTTGRVRELRLKAVKLSHVTKEQILSSNVVLFTPKMTLSKKPFTVFI